MRVTLLVATKGLESMYAPILEIDTRKIEENARKLHTFCARRGVELAFVTKGFSARPGVIRAARAGGVTRFADSRLKNIIAAKTAIPGLHYLLIRIPAIDEAEEVVRWADCSLQSQIEVIRAVSDAAVRQGKIHPIMLMVDEEIAGQILGCPGVELVGLGTNVGCYGSILPSVENTQILVELRDFLNEKYGFHIKTLSGGSTCTLKLLEEGRLPVGINHLRVGEGLLYGEDTTGMRFLEGYHTDAFHFKAQVVELRRKPSVPIGEHGRDGKGGAARIPRPGVHLRAICAAGKQDVAWAALTPPAGGGDDRRQLRPPDCRRGGVRRPGKGGRLAGLPLRLYGGAGRHHLRLCGRAGGVNGLLRGQNENESGSRMASALVHFVEKASQSSHPQARSK